jgi:Uma2 family endonuclease
MSAIPKRPTMSAIPKRPTYSFEDFCLLVKDGQKGDLIDGVIYVASPDSTDANSLNGWLYFLMAGVAARTRQGKVYFSRVAFRLGDLHSPELDLAFVFRNRLHLVRRGFIAGRPDLAMEIVSPDSIERDYEDKRHQYEEFGVPEYWIIDELQQKVTLLRLGKNGKYREVKPRRGELRSMVLRGFWIRPEWLWLETLPENLDVLNQLLARLEPPAKS